MWLLFTLKWAKDSDYLKSVKISFFKSNLRLLSYKLCKLGRALGYGVCMVLQRPVCHYKRSLVTYIINVMQTRGLIAIKDQISMV